MKFIIETVKYLDKNEKPCEEAYKGKLINSVGQEDDCWFIDINSLEELLAFIDKHNIDVIIDPKDDGMYKITFHDGYMY